MEALFSDQLKPVSNDLKILTQLYKDSPAVDAPILKTRLHNSCIWENFSLIGLEDIDLNHDRDRDDFMQLQFEKIRAESAFDENSSQTPSKS